MFAYSCQNGHTELAKSLLVNNYLTDSHDFENNFFDSYTYTQTPLYTACSNNHLAIVKLLLKFEHKNDYGFQNLIIKQVSQKKYLHLQLRALIQI